MYTKSHKKFSARRPSFDRLAL